MVLELVKTIACHRAALQELAELGDNKTSKRCCSRTSTPGTVRALELAPRYAWQASHEAP